MTDHALDPARGLEAAIARLEHAAAIWFNQDLHEDLRMLIAAARRKMDGGVIAPCVEGMLVVRMGSGTQ